MNALAPIALFTFKRPKHTEIALRSLLANPEFVDSPIHIYCDGARSPAEAAEVAASRNIVKALAPKHAVIVERESNLGLDRSVVAGVDELCARYGKLIVLEDDLEVAPGFLGFMNEGLIRYESEVGVMQVSGFLHPCGIQRRRPLFLPFTNSWGWGTWARAWESFSPKPELIEALKHSSSLRKAFDLEGSFPYVRMLVENMEKPFPAWDIVFYAATFERSGLVLYPPYSLVRNNGFDGSGTNCGVYQKEKIEFRSEKLDSGAQAIQVDRDALASVIAYLRHEQRISTRVLRRIMAYAARLRA